MLLISLICLGFIAFYAFGSHPNSFPHHPGSHRYHLSMGVGMCGAPTCLCFWVKCLEIGWTLTVTFASLVVRFIGFYVFGMHQKNLPHHSCSLRYHLSLGVGMSGEPTFPSSWLKRMDIGCTLAAGFASLVIGFIALYVFGMHSENLPHHSCSLRYHLSLGVGMCGEPTSPSFWVQCMEIGCTLAASFVSLLILATVLLSFSGRRRFHNKTRGRYRKLGSYNWTRRRVYWLQRRVSRNEYIALASRNKRAARKWFEMKPTQTTSTRVPTSFAKTANPAVTVERKQKDDVQGEAMNTIPLDKKKRCSPRKIGISSSNDCRRSPSKQVPFFATPKRTKKRMGFRRRCGDAVNLRFACERDGDFKSKLVRNAPRRKKKVRRALSTKLTNSTLTPELKNLPAPSYHVSYNKALEVYKTMRKGQTFHASKRVIWRNRHRLVLGCRYNNKETFYEGYHSSPIHEKEYDVPEPPEEDDDPQCSQRNQIGGQFSSNSIGDGPACDGDSHVYTCGPCTVSYQRCYTIGSVREPTEQNEAPQWIEIGPEFSSDYTGDGPQSSEEYDPEKDQASKRKRNNRKANRRLRRKRKQRDPENRSSEYNERTKRRRAGAESCARSIKRKSERRQAGGYCT